MKNEVSVIELKHLAQELRQLEGSRIQKIYQPNRATLLFSLKTQDGETRLLRISVPKYAAITKYKEQVPQKISGFCGLLRKNLEGRIIDRIIQLKNERILRFDIGGEGGPTMYAELFGKGNLILCESDDSIIGAMQQAVSGGRVIKPGVQYQPPEREAGMEELGKKEFERIILEPNAENISTTLAVNMGVGGLISRELCTLSGIDPGAEQVGIPEAEKLFVAFEATKSRKFQPLLVMKNGKPYEVIPFQMKLFENEQTVPLESLSDGIDILFKAEQAELPASKPKDDGRAKKISKAIAIQKQKAEEMEKTAQREQKAGEYIYENYQKVKDVLAQISEMMTSSSLQEIKKKATGKGMIKEVDPEKGTVTLEID